MLKMKKKLIFLLLGLFGLFIGSFIFFRYSPVVMYEAPAPLKRIFSFGPNINSADKRVNILLLGNAGGNHAGAYLTDTIMVASLNYETNKAYLISLPRDLWIDEVKGKVNTLYEIGFQREDGLVFAKEIVGKLVGLPIHYAVRVDFNGFVKAVDEVDGIEVSIKKPFDDYLYPISGKEDDLCGYREEEREFNEEDAKNLNVEPGKRNVLISPEGNIATDSAEPNKGYEYFNCRYEHISFKKGSTVMDGETSLKFVRSRMGTNGEGSDFARSNRQQEVLESLRAKILSLETLVNPARIASLVTIFGNSFETDLQINEIIELYKIVKKLEGTASFVISNSGKDPLLMNPPVGEYGAWVLIPQDETYGEIQSYVQKIIKGEMSENEATSSARTRNN